MHDLDELKRQWDEARLLSRHADRAEKEAEYWYAEAACAKMRADLDAQGFTEGAKVRVAHKKWDGTFLAPDVVAVGPVEWDYDRPRLTFYKVKKDGTPGRARARVAFSPRHDFLERVEAPSDGDAT